MPKPTASPLSPTNAVEVRAPRRKRRDYSAAEKLRIVRAADACTASGEIGALLRREGIYASLLSGWRKAIAAHGNVGLSAHKRGRKAKHDAKDLRVLELETKLKRAEKELGIVQQLLALQKKVSELLEMTPPSSVMR